MQVPNIDINSIDWTMVKVVLGGLIGYFYSAALVFIGHFFNKNGG
jgi:hypothetical protein